MATRTATLVAHVVNWLSPRNESRLDSTRRVESWAKSSAICAISSGARSARPCWPTFGYDQDRKHVKCLVGGLCIVNKPTPTPANNNNLKIGVLVGLTVMALLLVFVLFPFFASSRDTMSISDVANAVKAGKVKSIVVR